MLPPTPSPKERGKPKKGIRGEFLILGVSSKLKNNCCLSLLRGAVGLVGVFGITITDSHSKEGAVTVLG